MQPSPGYAAMSALCAGAHDPLPPIAFEVLSLFWPGVLAAAPSMATPARVSGRYLLIVGRSEYPHVLDTAFLDALRTERLFQIPPHRIATT